MCEEELSESLEESIDSDGDPLYSPTPSPSPSEIPLKVYPVDMPNEMFFGELSQLQKFIETLNRIRGCKTPGCKGDLVPVWVTTRGLGGGLIINYLCNGCASEAVVFQSSSNGSGKATNNCISRCLQVAFITAGLTHTGYQKTLRHALGLRTIDRSAFQDTTECMHPIVKGILDDMCESAKNEMKEMDDGQLGSWKRAVTTADFMSSGNSKNATFTIRNYHTKALLYYHHLCQKGSTRVTGEELYAGSSKSAESYGACVTFQKAKDEGMEIVIVHWQNADSSSASGIFPNVEIKVHGGPKGKKPTFPIVSKNELEVTNYNVSTNLELLQSNLTYMHTKHGTGYHWIPELYRRMNLPVFDGVEKALERHTVEMKKHACRAKTTAVKKRKIERKEKQVLEESQRLEWSQKHGHN